MSAHRFTVGQPVRFVNRFNPIPKAEEVFHVTGTLPPRGNSLQYRIRNDEERYERVTTEDTLEEIQMSPPEDGDQHPREI